MEILVGSIPSLHSQRICFKAQQRRISKEGYFLMILPDFLNLGGLFLSAEEDETMGILGLGFRFLCCS